MSEPDAAFLKLRIARADLIRWLDAPVPLASSWADWRSIGGQWYFDGVQALKDVSEQKMSSEIADCDAQLRRFSSNREALAGLLSDDGEAPQLRRIVYQAATQDFIAGTLTYSENLRDFMVFLTVARGAAAFLDAQGYGIVLIHNYLFGSGDEQISQAALRLGPGAKSEFMDEAAQPGAAGAFQPIVDAMIRENAQPSDELDSLK